MMRFVQSLMLLAACGGSDPAVETPTLTGEGARWTEADALFRQDPRWLGGDAAYSVDLGNDTSLWLFGDSFIATSDAHVRSQSTLVRNSIAIMTGRDPVTATMQFLWTDSSPPTSFFPEHGDTWSWPLGVVGAGDGSAIVFLAEQRAVEGGLGFEGAGYRVSRVTQGPVASELPSTPAPFDADAAVSCATVDEGFIVAVFGGRLARWPSNATDFSTPEWFADGTWSVSAMPSIVIPSAASECSLHRDATTGLWVYVQSRGFGATKIAIRSAPALEGPWSAAEDVFTPPESAVDDAFVYAGKAHPQLVGLDGQLVVTYADNSFTFADLFEPDTTLYYPHVATLSLRER